MSLLKTADIILSFHINKTYWIQPCFGFTHISFMCVGHKDFAAAFEACPSIQKEHRI
jgi:hypothetical protein